MKKNVICFGEILWDMLPQGARIGGAPLNVCYHLNRQQIDSKIISQTGEDKLGEALIYELKELDIDVSFSTQTKEYPTSTVQVKLDSEGKASYEIVEQVAWDYIPYKAHIAEAISNADAFVYGSLAARSTQSFDTLSKYLASAKYAILDINLRWPYYSKDVIFELMSKCQTLKINDEEILIIGEWLGESKDESLILKLITEHFSNINEIILTKGADGALYYNADQIVKVFAYPILVADTIGSGDSFLAGFLANKLQGKAIKDCLEYAALLSAYVATKAGACPNYSEKDIVEFKKTLHHD